MKWYVKLGLSKDVVSVSLKRSKLIKEFPRKEEYILNLTDRGVKILTNKNITDEDKNIIILTELTEVKEMKKIIDKDNKKTNKIKTGVLSEDSEGEILGIISKHINDKNTKYALANELINFINKNTL